MPILKSFLKDGEAESYRNVEVTFVPGKRAVMTLFEGRSAEAREDWVELEKIILSDYKTKEEMHELMVEKGFTLKSEEEIAALKLQKQKEAVEEEERKTKRREEAMRQREERKASEKKEGGNAEGGDAEEDAETVKKETKEEL
ncbi:hypothetical protein ACHAXT_003449 [Thalassiosira profunda]